MHNSEVTLTLHQNWDYLGFQGLGLMFVIVLSAKSQPRSRAPTREITSMVPLMWTLILLDQQSRHLE